MPRIKKSLTVRLLEILPGTLAWTTLITAPVLSYYKPAWVAIYIILFDFFWFLKGGNVAFHLIHSYGTLRLHRKIDWFDLTKRLVNFEEYKAYLQQEIESQKDKKLRKLFVKQLERAEKVPAGRMTDWQKIHHLLVLPIYKEEFAVLKESIDSFVNADYPMDKTIFVLALEERAGEVGEEAARQVEAAYSNKFYKFLITRHPDGIEGEVRGKAANMTWAVKEARKLVDELGISYEDVIFSGFDSDTVISKNYFSYLTHTFLTSEKPHQASYQPLPVYHNNIWDTPAIARVIAVTGSFWQLIEASRPDRFITFSSHSMSLKTLIAVNYFRVDSINEDSYIFWQCFNYFNGDYKTEPLFTTVSMDAVMGTSYWDTLIAQYKQKRRWAYGASQIALVFPAFYRNRLMPRWKKLLYGYRMLEGYYFWATASVMISILGWMPLIIGGDRFGSTVLANNLPYLTRFIMSVATFFLIFSVYINLVTIPPRPARYGRIRNLYMVLQWVFSPIVSSVFGSLPAIDAQTRLMFGRYMEFWVTPKVRKAEATDVASGPEISKEVIK